MRLGERAGDPQVVRRLQRILSKDEGQRRLSFSAHVEHAYPEARRAPLVLFRLFPLSVAVATALASGQFEDANELRRRQISWLPAIQDCRQCHGVLLTNGEMCLTGSNPIWNYRWLTAAD